MTTALVTGPTSGLGRQFAIQLAAAGHDLILVSRDETRLTELSMELSESYGTDSEIIPTDLSDRDQLAVVEARLADP
ncbi:MAG: SDR family NAD(P)-dependent oxidoreductase, partial [Actinobacteria bacterium]|nr:SDR family NAD(P)-dependent oxidoreductase [Actinomycetota bacterium]